MSDKLMQLAKAEGGGLLSTEQHDLISLLKLILDDKKRSSATGNATSGLVIEMTLPTSGEFISIIDTDAIATGIGASITFNSPASGKEDGFEVKVNFPLLTNR